MKSPINIETTSSPACLRRQYHWQLLVALGFIAVLPVAEAVTPPPDGGYPGDNTAEGANALFSLTSGTNNTAMGSHALLHDTSGSKNAATGSQALSSNTAGTYNTANGYVALFSNTTGNSNTGIGAGSLHSNATASRNTALGYVALYNNTTGNDNTAVGNAALRNNTSFGSENTAVGSQALTNNLSGGQANTAIGYQSLNSNTNGGGNTALGWQALTSNVNGVANTAIGAGTLANANGNENIALGDNAGVDLLEGNNNIYIGNRGCCVFSGESDTIRIGDPTVPTTTTFVAGVHGASISNGAAVYVNSDGQLGNTTSSARFKQDIQSMGQASETVLALRPVTFRHKSRIDRSGTLQFGLVAEEVEKVNPDLVLHDKEGKPFSVRYDQVNAMLLNEFLKEHRKVQELEAPVAKQARGLDTLAAQLKEQATQIQRVIARVQMTWPVKTVVLNDQ